MVSWEDVTAMNCPEKLAVIGGGYIGLHTAVHAAKNGVNNVLIIDINPRVVESINSGKLGDLHVQDHYIQENWEHVKQRIKASTRYEDVEEYSIYIVAVQTPLYKGRIDYTPLLMVAESLSKVITRGSLVVSETTTYPGGTVELLGKPIEEKTGLIMGEDFYLAHAPERINPGSTFWTPENIPRVVGGVNETSLKKALGFYENCLRVKTHPVRDIRIAEASKLLENAFRFINISFINDLKKRFDQKGIDIREVIKASATKPFGYMPFWPGPYVGGPCLPKDTYMLDEYIDSLIIKIAKNINTEQPRYYALLVLREIRRVNARRILFLGLGYKPDSYSTIGSPPLNIARELGSIDPTLEIRLYDPNIRGTWDFNNLQDAVEWADIIVRWGYKNLETNKPVVDLENL